MSQGASLLTQSTLNRFRAEGLPRRHRPMAPIRRVAPFDVVGDGLMLEPKLLLRELSLHLGLLDGEGDTVELLDGCWRDACPMRAPHP